MKWLNQAVHISTNEFVVYSNIFNTRRCVYLEEKDKAHWEGEQFRLKPRL